MIDLRLVGQRVWRRILDLSRQSVSSILRFSVICSFIVSAFTWLSIGASANDKPAAWPGRAIMPLDFLRSHFESCGILGAKRGSLEPHSSALKPEYRQEHADFVKATLADLKAIRTNPNDLTLKGKLAEHMASQYPELANLMAMQLRVRTNATMGMAAEELDTAIDRLMQSALTKLVPPEIIDLSLADDATLELIIEDGLFTGVQMPQQELKHYGQKLASFAPITFDRLVINSEGESIQLEPLINNPLLRKTRRLALISNYCIHPIEMERGAFARLLGSAYAAGLRELTLKPYTRELHNLLYYGHTGVLHAELTQLTLYDLLPTPRWTQPTANGKSIETIGKRDWQSPIKYSAANPEQKGHILMETQDWDLLIRKIKIAFPKLKTLKIQFDHGSEADKLRLRDTAIGAGVDLELF